MMRLLVVVTGMVPGDELARELKRHTQGATAQVRIVAPALVESALHHAAGDVDEGFENATRRLEQSLRDLDPDGFEIESCEVGDSDPMLAIGDQLRKAPADEILLVTHTDEDALWMEEDLFDRLRREIEQPITHIVINREGGAPHTEEAGHSGPGRDQPEAAMIDTPSKGNPAWTARNLFGILVAVVGTLALFLVAAECVNEQSRDADDWSTGCLIQMLIAGAMGLINIAHVVGMVLFSSTGYRGLPEKFFSRFSLIGTPVALLVVVLIATID